MSGRERGGYRGRGGRGGGSRGRGRGNYQGDRPPRGSYVPREQRDTESRNSEPSTHTVKKEQMVFCFRAYTTERGSDGVIAYMPLMPQVLGIVGLLKSDRLFHCFRGRRDAYLRVVEKCRTIIGEGTDCKAVFFPLPACKSMIQFNESKMDCVQLFNFILWAGPAWFEAVSQYEYETHSRLFEDDVDGNIELANTRVLKMLDTSCSGSMVSEPLTQNESVDGDEANVDADDVDDADDVEEGTATATESSKV